jgi:ADP-heptose:LPS heptosyltransferase
MHVVISPFSKKMRNGKENPKNYPHWKEVVERLQEEAYEVFQISVDSEPDLGCDERLTNMPIWDLQSLIERSHVWIAVDNFLGHFAHHIGKPGIVIFGKSDPAIFGYPENCNMLKHQMYLRQKQFDIWERESFNAKVFVDPEEIVKQVENWDSFLAKNKVS